ncbi:MAG: ABC transporter permease subunit [Anaerolineae bacterium]|nr:ABC transporter permease subunit [Anaerolineae bacterium]
MLTDIGAIILKEWQELFSGRSGKRNGGLYSVLVALGLIGVYMPVMMRDAWITQPMALATWSWLPVFWTMGIITSAIAGERERHTLETLLASRLSDQSILVGKILAAVLYAWGMMFVSSLLGVVVVNVAFIEGPFQFYNPAYYLGIQVAILLLAGFFSTLGVLVSLHAPTARQAYQKMSIVMLVLYVIPMVVTQFLPQAQIERVVAVIRQLQINWNIAVPLILAGALLLDVLLFLLASARFQRDRLILD